VSDVSIEDLGDVEPYDGLWRFARLGRRQMLAAAAGVFLGLVAFGALVLVERDHQATRVATAPCTVSGRAAPEVVRTFLGRIERGDRDAMRSCWSLTDEADRWIDRLVPTKGVSQVEILTANAGADQGGHRLINVLAAPTWRIEADVLWPNARPKWFLLREEEPGVWALRYIQTPLWSAGSCMDGNLPPDEIVRTFFALLDERQPVGMAECFVPSAERDVIIYRLLAAGGFTSLAITNTRPLPDGYAVRVFLQWRASPWSGDCCQRWFVLKSDGGQWKIASVEASPPGS
jgi:hypothetical protein